ncbi:hypothetical protein [Kitasatospora herbaricolor]|uniref:Uncharacterized protein n=1 Tax=Kitasatospora herbaricolor TaxID=68217 RepID=A0ABZ1WF22_9ACTN|nr:hypothetical protein [Kitasatospora herbaricolor]
MKIVEIEVDQYRWTELRCGCGVSAAHVAAELRQLVASTEDNEFDIEKLDGHILIPSVLLEPSVPTVSVILAALSDDISPSARESCLQLLLLLISGEGQATELELSGRDLVAECISAARDGLWLLYSEVISGHSIDAASNAFEVLSLIEENAERLDRVRVAASEYLRWDLR